MTECASLGVAALCEAFGVSRSGYYRFASGRVSARSRRRSDIAAFIRERFAESRSTYGYRRIAILLERAGLKANRKTVAAIMRA